MAQKIVAYGIIPLYTVLFTRGYDRFTTNLSVIANYFDKKLAFLIWGLLVGGYFCHIHRKIKQMTEQGSMCRKLIPAAVVLLLCSITTPYLPEEMPLRADLHIIFAFGSAVCLFLYLLSVILKQLNRNKQRYLPYLSILIGIMLISVYLLVRVGIVSSALEIFVTVSTVVLSDRLISSLKAEKTEEESAYGNSRNEDTQQYTDYVFDGSD